MTPETTRPSLLSRLRDPSDSAAWREFEDRYRELVLRYGRGRGLQPSDAEDVHQTVMMSLSQSLPTFGYDPARGRFRDYLGRVVRNAINRQLAHPKTAERALDSAVLACVPADDEAELDAGWEEEWKDHHYRLAMQTVRATFEPRSVEMFDRLLAGESVESLAAAYATTTQAVHKVKQRVRDRLHALIAAQIREEDDPDGPPSAA
jgi:RNA polymerase sigma-70 factor (ECF subfamily)